MKSKMMKTMKITLGLFVFSLLVGRSAWAQEPVADPRVDEARTTCMAGEVQKGIRLLAELYTASEDPIWIFNQGRCYHQNAQPTLALSRFKEFVRQSKGGPGDEDVRDAQNYITEIETELQRERSASGAVATGDATTQPTRADATAATLTSPLVTPEAASTNPPIYKRWWFWTGIGAAVVAGTVTAFLVAHGSGNSPCTGIGPNCVEFK
jgi:hypothetical protein